jgi:hypothetical protein
LNTSLDVISSDRVEGTAVYNTEGKELGSIDDLMIDKRTGEVRYALIEFGGFLGIGTDRYPLPWRVPRYSNDKGGYVRRSAEIYIGAGPPSIAMMRFRPTTKNLASKRIDSYYGDYYLHPWRRCFWTSVGTAFKACQRHFREGRLRGNFGAAADGLRATDRCLLCAPLGLADCVVFPSKRPTDARNATASALSPLVMSAHLSSMPNRLPLRVSLSASGESDTT